MTSGGMHTQISDSVLASHEAGAHIAALIVEPACAGKHSLLLPCGESVDHDIIPDAHANPVLCRPL